MGNAYQVQYRTHLSDFQNWSQRKHAEQWLLYPQNLGTHLSIDETSLSHGELYTILTNKAAKGQKGSIVAIIAGTKVETVIAILRKIPEKLRKKVTEITLDMAGNMTVRRYGPDCQKMFSTSHSGHRPIPCSAISAGSRPGDAG
jgi:transposase